MQSFVDFVSVQQDYLWFIALLVWLPILIGSLRRENTELPSWAKWSALAAFITIVAAVEALARPVVATTDRPLHLGEDVVLAIAETVQLVGWVVGALPSLLAAEVVWLVVAVVSAGVGWWHMRYPEVTIPVLSIGTAVSGLLLARRRRERLAESAGILVLVLAACISPIGPFALKLDNLLRWSELSPFGAFYSAAIALAAGLLLGGLALSSRRFAGMAIPPGHAMRSVLYSSGACLVTGLLVAGVTGGLAREHFERSAIARVSTAAAFLNASDDRMIFENTLGASFRPSSRSNIFVEPAGSSLPFAFAASLMGPDAQRVKAELKRIAKENRDVRFVQIETIRWGEELTVFANFSSLRYNGVVAPIRRVNTASLIRWANRESYFEGPTTVSYGEVTFARAPILGARGQPLGWLTFVFGVGQWESVQATARMLTFSVAALAVVASILLIIQRMRLREHRVVLTAAAAAEEASRMKSRFLANVSHELRTPIQTILGYAEMLGPCQVDSVAAQRVAQLRSQADLMARLVNDLIDLAAIESGAFQFVRGSLSLMAVVESALEPMRQRALEKGLSFRFTVEGMIPLSVEGDAHRLRQLVANLVGNAVKYTAAGAIEVQLVSVDQADDGEMFELRVRDTGPGIRAEEMGRLFQPFSRLPMAMKTEGTGLGLALSAAMCRSLGGGLSATSDGRTGSEFTARFRLRKLSVEVPRPNEDATNLAGKRILVADDNYFVRELFVAYLSSLGAVCEVAVDGVQACDLAIREVFDALVLDLSMPELDGRGVAKRLREQGSRVRIVGVSAHAGANERSDALSAGMDQFLSKPVELAELARAVLARPIRPVQEDRFKEQLDRWAAEFVRGLATEIDKLGAAQSQGDWQLVRRLAHHLRNSAIVVHDHQMVEVLQQLETAAEQSDRGRVGENWRRCVSLTLDRQALSGSPGPVRNDNHSNDHV